MVYPSGSKPARIYGLHKLHKTFDDYPNFRPIISSLGTFNYNLASHLGDILIDLIPNKYSCRDTFMYLTDLQMCDISNKYIISYDICSLFTNIPLEETYG